MANTGNVGLIPLVRFFRLLRKDRKDIIYIYVFAIFNGVITLILPLGIQAIIALISGGQISASWAILTVFVVLGIVFSGILKVIQLKITEVLQQRIFARAAFDFAVRIPKFKSEALFNKYPPELVNRFFEVNGIQKGLPKILTEFSTSALEIFFGLLLLGFYHPFFIVFGLFFISLIIMVIILTYKKGLRTSLLESNYKYETGHWLEELAASIHTFKFAGNNKLAVSKTDQLVSGYLVARQQHFKILMFQFISIISFKALITGTLLILGSILVINNEINLGQFVASEIVIILIINAAEKLISSMEVVYDLLTSIEKLGSITDIDIENEGGMAFTEISKASKGIELKVKDLSYLFPSAGKPAINQISFDIKQSEKLCISGFNGSGKSTVIKIITGIYENFTGSVTINGVPLKNLQIDQYRSFIGDHTSSEDVFKGTVKENILLGHEDTPIQKLLDISKLLHLDDFINELPKGYDTMLEPRGGRLPGSIVQKITLARSIIHQPHFLILEESFSKLAHQEKTDILKYLMDGNQSWTILFVTNDPEIARLCDRVLILEAGQIIDSGDPSIILNHNCFNKYIPKD